MSSTEKVSISGTALSFLLYECLNSTCSKEGLLLGEVTEEITTHISDLRSYNARLDTQIKVRAVLPLPISIFYTSIGSIKEDVLSDLLLNHSSEVVGWYKYRTKSIKPTLRDKLISINLQRYFEKRHDINIFATCNLSTRSSLGGSTLTYIYRFSKLNLFGMQHYIEDITENLGEKILGYKKSLQQSPHSIFNKIVQESSVLCNNSSDAILNIQQAVDVQLVQEAKIAANTECTIRDLAAKIQKLTKIVTVKQLADLKESQDKTNAKRIKDQNKEIIRACRKALKKPAITGKLKNRKAVGKKIEVIDLTTPLFKIPPIPTISPVMKPLALNYSRVVKKNTRSTKSEKPSTSNQENCSVIDVEGPPPPVRLPSKRTRSKRKY